LEERTAAASSAQAEQFPPQVGAAIPDIPFLLSRQWVPEIWLKGQIQDETQIVPNGHAPALAGDFMGKGNTKQPLVKGEAGNYERPHFPVLQVRRQLL